MAIHDAQPHIIRHFSTVRNLKPLRGYGYDASAVLRMHLTGILLPILQICTFEQEGRLKKKEREILLISDILWAIRQKFGLIIFRLSYYLPFSTHVCALSQEYQEDEDIPPCTLSGYVLSRYFLGYSEQFKRESKLFKSSERLDSKIDHSKWVTGHESLSLFEQYHPISLNLSLQRGLVVDQSYSACQKLCT
jgi:hypothetical protein